jgi:flagellar biosynthesis protein FlhB
MATDQDHSERTEQPTSRRRQELRQQGNLARSADLNVAAIALAGAAALNFLGENLTNSLQQILRQSLTTTPHLHMELGTVVSHIQKLALQVGAALLPWGALMIVAAVAVNAFQAGFVVSTTPLVPNLSRVNPLAGWRRMWSLVGWARGAMAVVKVTVATTIVFAFISDRLPTVFSNSNSDLAGFARQLGNWLSTLAFQLALGLLVLALLDYGFQLWKFEQEIKMTKEELREELRQTEGNPQVRDQQRDARRKLRERQAAESAVREQNSAVA